MILFLSVGNYTIVPQLQKMLREARSIVIMNFDFDKNVRFVLAIYYSLSIRNEQVFTKIFYLRHTSRADRNQ